MMLTYHLKNKCHKTRKKFETISIRNINPSELSSFMKSNDIPDNACFSGTDNGYDGWNDIVLAWEVDISTTEAEKLEFKKIDLVMLPLKRCSIY